MRAPPLRDQLAALRSELIAAFLAGDEYAHGAACMALRRLLEQYNLGTAGKVTVYRHGLTVAEQRTRSRDSRYYWALWRQARQRLRHDDENVIARYRKQRKRQ
jgi:hypothetical protein